MASTGGAIAPVVSVASTTCVAFDFFGALSGFAGALSCVGALGVWAVASGAVVSILPTATRADDLGESLVGNSTFGVDGWATPVASVVVFGAGALGASAGLLGCAAGAGAAFAPLAG